MFDNVRQVPYAVIFLREIRKITEMREGCIYRTRSLGHVLIPFDYKVPEGYMICSPSSKVLNELHK